MATRLICIAFLSLCFINNSFSDDKNFVILDKKNNFVQISLLDKITSKKQTVKINLKEKTIIKNFEIYVDKCVKDYRNFSTFSDQG